MAEQYHLDALEKVSEEIGCLAIAAEHARLSALRATMEEKDARKCFAATLPGIRRMRAVYEQSLEAIRRLEQITVSIIECNKQEGEE